METNYTRYVIFLSHIEGSIMSEALIREHVRYLKELEKKKKLVMCGPFTNFKGGMVIIKAQDLNEATQIAQNDPFVVNHIETFEIRIWELSCEENNHMGMG